MKGGKEGGKVSNCTHYWIIDSDNVGHCRYCPEVKDFGRLLQREGVFAAAGRRGAKASKGVPRKPYGSRRRRKKKEEFL
ncbi:hypothetical protein ES703_84466 [subsurface metagenome]